MWPRCGVEEALQGADGCILQADWPQFGELRAGDFTTSMRTPVVVDGRRILDLAKMKGVRFRRIGSS
ncbi:MAG: UDP binding domain-containing protein [Armatimonadota bacterium]